MAKIMVHKILYCPRGDPQGKVVDVAYGEYKPEDVKIFEEAGFIDVDKGLAKKLAEEGFK